MGLLIFNSCLPFLDDGKLKEKKFKYYDPTFSLAATNSMLKTVDEGFYYIYSKYRTKVQFHNLCSRS